MAMNAHNLKIGIISQARMTSTRLPGKVLKMVKSQPLLKYHIERLKKSGLQVFIATTTNNTDLPIVEFCKQESISYFCGDEMDVLQRYYQAAKQFKLDIVIRVTSDCPLIDGELIAKALKQYLAHANHENLYLSNCLKRSYPRGFDFEIFTFANLEEAYKLATLQQDREHVTPYLHQNRNQKMQFISIEREQNASQFRITVDEPDDFKLVEKLISDFNADKLNCDEICEVLEKNPHLAAINQHVEQKKL